MPETEEKYLVINKQTGERKVVYAWRMESAWLAADWAQEDCMVEPADPDAPAERRYMNIFEVADLLKISIDRTRALADRGIIPCLRIVDERKFPRRMVMQAYDRLSSPKVMLEQEVDIDLDELPGNGEYFPAGVVIPLVGKAEFGTFYGSVEECRQFQALYGGDIVLPEGVRRTA